jgi:hypothetical protein
MVRRVVTGVDGSGKSVVVMDGRPPVTREYVQTPGFADSFIWHTDSIPSVATETADKPLANFIPGPGETVALTVTLPPGSVYADPGYDPTAARAEDLALMPGLIDLFETDAPGMHATPTVDYVVVTEGEVVLELDDGATVSLNTGDVVVQNATRHAWRNRTDKPASFFVVLTGLENVK